MECFQHDRCAHEKADLSSCTNTTLIALKAVSACSFVSHKIVARQHVRYKDQSFFEKRACYSTSLERALGRLRTLSILLLVLDQNLISKIKHGKEPCLLQSFANYYTVFGVGSMPVGLWQQHETNTNVAFRDCDKLANMASKSKDFSIGVVNRRN